MALGPPTSQKFNSNPSIAKVVSPCMGVCTLAPSGLCIGCLRSSEEIGKWLSYTTGDRARIMIELPQRLKSLFAPRIAQ